MLKANCWLVIAGALLPVAVPAAGQPGVEAAIAQSRQMIVVTTSDWSADHGVLALYERTTTEGAWQRVSAQLPVTLARNGLAWGIGLHACIPTKCEGDERSPAGVFQLEKIYGWEREPPSSHFPYQPLSETMEGIDDPQSRFYNRLVDSREVKKPDWTHSEKVLRASNPMFRWCVMVKHNWEQRPGYGSCIYLHIWQAPGIPTSGCTAMGAATLDRIVHWLDAHKRPLLVQLPRTEFRRAGLTLALVVSLNSVL